MRRLSLLLICLVVGLSLFLIFNTVYAAYIMVSPASVPVRVAAEGGFVIGPGW